MLDLKKKSIKKITSRNEFKLLPKSFRCSSKEIDIINELKDKIMAITGASKCSDSKVINLALLIANNSKVTDIKKALSEKL